VNISSYNIAKYDDKNRNTGEVIIYVRNDIKYEIVLIKKRESNCCSATIEVKEKLYKGIIIVVYHLLSASDTNFVRFLNIDSRRINNKKRMYCNRRLI